MNEVAAINQTLAGHYKVGVVDPHGNVEWQAEGKNLILNQGMDQLYTNTLVDCMTYGICGTGTRQNSIGGGASKVSQAGTQLTLTDAGGDISSFTANAYSYNPLVSAGDYLVYANGSQSRVTSVTNATTMSVTPSYTFSDETFVLWKTSQVGLQTEVSRSSTYVAGVGNCESTISESTITHRRTYDFPINNWITMQFNELGVGWASSGPTTVFSRIQIDPITVLTGFRLRLIYDLRSSWSPTGSLYGSASIGGWPNGGSTNTDGTQSIQNFNTSTVNNDGSSNNNYASLDPAFTSTGGYRTVIWVSNNSSSLADFGSSNSRTAAVGTASVVGTVAMSKAPYTNGSYICDKTGTVTNLSSNGIRSFGFGPYNTSPSIDPRGTTYQSYCFRMNQSQSLLNTEQLSLTFRHTWDRTLA